MDAVVILGLERAEPTQAKPLWSGTTPGADSDCPGSGPGHWMKKCWEVRPQRTATASRSQSARCCRGACGLPARLPRPQPFSPENQEGLPGNAVATSPIFM